MSPIQYKTRLTNHLINTFEGNQTWHNKTFYSYLSERVNENSDKVVLTDYYRSVTYRQLKDEIDRCANYFRQLGIVEGDVVTIQFPNRIEFAVIFLSLELIGAIANTISPDFRKREVEYIIKFAKSRVYISASSFKGFDYAQMIADIKNENSELDIVIVSGQTSLQGFYSLEDGIGLCEPLEASSRVKVNPNSVMRMAFTSGTTGDPKGVMHSHNTTIYACELINEEMAVTSEEVFLVWLPLGLNWGYLTLLQTILAGASAYLMERFHPQQALEVIEKNKITFIPTAPASLVAIMNVPDFKSFDCSSLRVVVTGGASAAIETIRDYQRFMSGHLIELYGMLETGFHTFTRFDDDPEVVNGTIGRVVGKMQIRIIDDDGNDVPYGEEGEIAAYGPSVHLGYYNNPDANNELFTNDDWFRTGDLGKFVDQHGNVMIVGRRKEIINRGGKKFFPREIEEILYGHPALIHPAMVGVADPRLGERNCLCVVLKPNASFSLMDAVQLLKGQVADYKLPEMLVVFDELPFTATGKIKRYELINLVKKRLE